ncbi:MAG: FadR family transcriptional regulator [Deltaproteobacteria bacterium]|nr:FadR family transcriptional regulator [Deltaproteobacteria bacterium]MBW2016986.1 FadR family transcriptional regulator [Deltaproteobacteria bacterium]MBW2130625.1 FadR family transcriptional regulator [Deltaproteobacteria bacterium]MBW2303700.1 FadR family transcriptional regulator [Deltaproteobacteria bacterium]
MTETMFRPLKKRRYSDQIAEMIQERIFNQHLKIGTNLPSEQELAQEFQVSRSVVREALRILEISGLVKIKKGPAGGIFVSNGYRRPIRKSLKYMVASGEVTIEHLFDVRLLIEPHVAGEAALHASREDLEKLEALFKECEAHQNDPVLLKKNNLNFHLLLAGASGNPLFSILLEAVFELLIESTLDFFDLALERHFYRVHQKIFEVISRKEPEEAARLIKEDILDVMEKIRSHKKGVEE